ncbi:dehydrogenase/reductase SDR family member 11-like [Clavelina lepadiformis]|uniref:Dehydrogenase/reductase SDR family member 11 n=1 Tax=Clavelina lepadiformis TaxID=159417 RepID=A0ABP0GSW1_CLALP
MESWIGKVALVTGASAGIGAAIVKKLVENGMEVVGCARNLTELNEIATKVNKAGPGHMYPYKCDLVDENQILAVFEYIKKQFGTIHICINNAAVCYHTPMVSADTEHLKEMINVNILALCIATREAITLMKNTNVDDGHIVNINGNAGHKICFETFYSATKYAVTALTEGLRQELRAANSRIRATAISPGLVKTELMYRMHKDDSRSVDELYATKPSLQPDDVANAVSFAITSPSHVEINDMRIRPTGQLN